MAAAKLSRIERSAQNRLFPHRPMTAGLKQLATNLRPDNVLLDLRSTSRLACGRAARAARKGEDDVGFGNAANEFSAI